MRRLIPASVLVALLGLSACVSGDRGRGLQQVASTRDTDRALADLVVYPCPGQSLAQASLWIVTKDGATLVRPIWRISRSSGTSTPRQILVGDTPQGFSQDVAFAGVPSDSANLAFLVRFGQEQVTLQLRMEDLKVDQLLVDPAWFSNHRYISLQDFQRENAKDC
jgi:hypothetical protein